MTTTAQRAFAEALRRAQARYRAELLSREGAVVSDIIQRFGAAYSAISDEVEALTAKIEAAREAGEEVRPVWLFQRDRMMSLEREIRRELASFSDYADRRIQQEQRAAIALGIEHAEQAVRSVVAAVAWDRPPIAALRYLVGASYSGPLSGLLGALGPRAAGRAREALFTGMALGRDPAKIARDLRAKTLMSLNRALVISRTETMRAYRAATIESYRRNQAVVQGWIWMAAEDACDFCAEMDGTFHDLSEEMDSHPNCRCCPAPQTGLASELE